MKIKTFAEALLIAFFVRLLIKGASIGDSIVICALLGYLGYAKYLAKLEVLDPTISLLEKITKLEVGQEKVNSTLSAYKMLGRVK